MEITSFILGVCTVIVLVMVVGTFVNYMSTKSLKEEINNLWQQAKDDEDARGRQHFEQINYTDTLNNNVHDEMTKLYGYVDSRHDKLENGVSQQIADLYRQLDKLENEGKSVING